MNTEGLLLTLGWSNTGPLSLSLYALDVAAPRWWQRDLHDNGRRAEYALTERGDREGTRYLLTRLGEPRDDTEVRLLVLAQSVSLDRLQDLAARAGVTVRLDEPAEQLVERVVEALRGGPAQPPPEAGGRR